MLKAPVHSSWFDGQPPLPTRVGLRQLYYYLVNAEEHPETWPLVHELVTRRLDAAAVAASDHPEPPPTASAATAALDGVLGRLAAAAPRFSRPWRQETEDLTRRQILHYFIQYLPTALVDGCWLQGGLRVATAHTPVGASLTGLYQHQVRAFAGPGRHFVADYRAVHARLGSAVDELSSHSFVNRADFDDSSMPLPIFLLGIAQLTRTFGAEIVGLNLAWQFLGLSAFGPDLVRDTCSAYGLTMLDDELLPAGELETRRGMARQAALRLLSDRGELMPAGAWSRLLRGVDAGVAAWEEWFYPTCAAAPIGPPDAQQEMIDLLWRKAPHACGYHAEKRLGAKRIDEYLAPRTFDGPALLAELAQSPWVKPGDPDRSTLLRRLIGFGGPMLAVFSPVEVRIIESWIDSLPSRDTDAVAATPGDGAGGGSPSRRSTAGEEAAVVGPMWTPAEFRRRSERRYRRCTVRELYHYLVNVELYPDVLPLAERFARNRLERSMAMLLSGERPIPSRTYDAAALERWVEHKHREQVDSYRPPAARPEVPRQAFIEATVQLAPLILIDGGWLQGVASPALIHTAIGGLLFHVLVEELGEGNPEQHHANVYRDLLAAMGEEAPQVTSWEFAHWPRLMDSSFEVPALWLSISCFPRHFLPEILGLNLAVELAGVGGPYMEARDTLRRLGYPSLFVDLHNAADNVSVGHAAWALKAITRYMDDLAEREGPHHLDPTWHRVWAGMRATLPQIGRLRLLGHRLGKRLFGADPALVPRIFPA